MAPKHGLDEVTKAKALLVLLALVWGLSWPIMTMALRRMSTMDALSAGILVALYLFS